jgi:hypothetical protein
VDNFIQYSKLILPKNYTNIPENWLKCEILDLLKYPLKIGKFALLVKVIKKNQKSQITMKTKAS